LKSTKQILKKNHNKNSKIRKKEKGKERKTLWITIKYAMGVG
jgi:hypothetical protein